MKALLVSLFVSALLPLGARAGWPPPVTPPGDFVDAAQAGEYVELRGADGHARSVVVGQLSETDRGNTAPGVYPTTISHVKLEDLGGGVREIAEYSCEGRRILLRLVGAPKPGGRLEVQSQWKGPYCTIPQDFYVVVYP